jgi:hypothetical protein
MSLKAFRTFVETREELWKGSIDSEAWRTSAFVSFARRSEVDSIEPLVMIDTPSQEERESNRKDLKWGCRVGSPPPRVIKSESHKERTLEKVDLVMLVPEEEQEKQQ